MCGRSGRAETQPRAGQKLTMLEPILLSPRQALDDPLGPLVAPRLPPRVGGPPVPEKLGEAVERGHGVDILGGAFSLGQVILQLEPFDRRLERVLRRGRGGRDGRVLR